MEQPPESGIHVDTRSALMIVVGAHLRAELADRPLAYRLQSMVEQWVKSQTSALNVEIVPVVCCDVWYINDQDLQKRPTISIGGPGVNALSAFYSRSISPAVLHENQIFVQLDPEFVDLRACIWGMDHQQTVDALDLFIREYLDQYLRAVATQVEPEEPESDTSDESDEPENPDESEQH